MADPEWADLNAAPVTVSCEGKSRSMDRAELRTDLLKYGSVLRIAPDPWAPEPLIKSRLCRGLSRPHLHATFKIQRTRKPHQRYDEDRRYQNPIHPHNIPFCIALHF